jgi:transcriptional regulator
MSKVLILYKTVFLEMLPTVYMTERQIEIWSLRLKRLSKAEIGRQLGITGQAVYDAEGVMPEKVE